MKKSVISFMLIFMLTCCCFLSACIFDGNTNTINVSGKIYLNSEPLEYVLLKTSTKIWGQSDLNGEFDITINSNGSVIVYPEKPGYEFTPKSVEITQDTKNLIFVAEKVKELDGLLSLAQIIITPTSISSFGDNYSFNQDGQTYLKINKFELDINGIKIDAINSNYLALKNKSNTINIGDDVTIETCVNFSIKFSLDACFVMGNTEYVYDEEKFSVLEVKEKQYTNDLTSKNQIEYTAVGINSSNNKYTYDVTFVFDYYKNI